MVRPRAITSASKNTLIARRCIDVGRWLRSCIARRHAQLALLSIRSRSPPRPRRAALRRTTEAMTPRRPTGRSRKRGRSAMDIVVRAARSTKHAPLLGDVRAGRRRASGRSSRSSSAAPRSVAHSRAIERRTKRQPRCERGHGDGPASTPGGAAASAGDPASAAPGRTGSSVTLGMSTISMRRFS